MDMQRWCGCATVEEGRGSESGGNGGNGQKVGGSLPRATAEVRVRVRVRVIASPTRVPLFQTLLGSLRASITTTLSLQHIGGSSTTLYARLLVASARYYHYVRLVLILPLYRYPSTDLEMLDSGLADRQDTTARRAVYHAAEPTTGSGILISRKRSWNCETVMSPAI